MITGYQSHEVSVKLFGSVFWRRSYQWTSKRNLTQVSKFSWTFPSTFHIFLPNTRTHVEGKAVVGVSGVSAWWYVCVWVRVNACIVNNLTSDGDHRAWLLSLTRVQTRRLFWGHAYITSSSQNAVESAEAVETWRQAREL